MDIEDKRGQKGRADQKSDRSATLKGIHRRRGHGKTEAEGSGWRGPMPLIIGVRGSPGNPAAWPFPNGKKITDIGMNESRSGKIHVF